MSFPFNVYLLATLSAFLTTLTTLPLWRRWSFRMGLVDDPGQRKIHGEATALAGVLAVITGLLVPVLLGIFALWLKAHGVDVRDVLFLRQAYSDATMRPALLDPAAAALLKYGLGRRALELAGILV